MKGFFLIPVCLFAQTVLERADEASARQFTRAETLARQAVAGRSERVQNLKRGEALELGRRLLGLALEEFSLNLRRFRRGYRCGGQRAQFEGRQRVDEKSAWAKRLAPLVAAVCQPAKNGGSTSGLTGR